VAALTDFALVGDAASDGPAAVKAMAATVAKTTLRPVDDLKPLRVNI
jgi:hypothetical protein